MLDAVVGLVEHTAEEAHYKDRHVDPKELTETFDILVFYELFVNVGFCWVATDEVS